MNKIIIGLAGEIASGKTHSSKYFIKKYQAVSYRFSTPLRDILDRMYIPESRESLTKLSTALRQVFGEEVLANIIYNDVKSSQAPLMVIDGVRRLDDIKHLRELPEFKFVYIETDQRKRFERITSRGENADDNAKTWEQFLADHQLETELQIPSLKQQADVVIDNNGTTEELHQKLDELVQQLTRSQ